MLDQATPGSEIRLTITTTPRAEAPRKTLCRLRKLDDAARKILKSAQVHRQKTLKPRIRAGVDWTQRPRIGSPSIERGQTWTIRYRPQYAADINSVSKYLKIETA